MKNFLLLSVFFLIYTHSKAETLAQSKNLNKSTAQTIISFSCHFTNNQKSQASPILVTGEIQSMTHGYQLIVDFKNIFSPAARYKATLLKADLKYFIFKGIPIEQNRLPIDIAIVEKNSPNKMCGAFQLLNSDGITVDGTLGCCTYMTPPSEEINFYDGGQR